MLTKIVSPERIMAEPGAVKALCTQCDYLPLALRIVGARLATRPHWSVAEMLTAWLMSPGGSMSFITAT